MSIDAYKASSGPVLPGLKTAGDTNSAVARTLLGSFSGPRQKLEDARRSCQARPLEEALIGNEVREAGAPGSTVGVPFSTGSEILRGCETGLANAILYRDFPVPVAGLSSGILSNTSARAKHARASTDIVPSDAGNTCSLTEAAPRKLRRRTLRA